MCRGELIFKFCHGINLLVLFILLLALQHVVAQDEDDKGLGNSLSPAMSIALICFISIFFLIAFFSLFIRHCTNHSDGPTNIFRRSPTLPAGRGLDPTVVNTYPTFLYSEVKGHIIGQTALECAVCLLEFEDEEILRLLPKCSHVFHPDCIDAWLAFHVTCPLCRSNLVPKPDELISHVITSTTPDRQSNSPPGNGTGSGSVDIDMIINISETIGPELIKVLTPNQSRHPPRSTPRRPKSIGNYINKFRRSHSTGHLILQAVDNRERFTLRLPENVRNELMKRSPSTSSPGVFPSTVRSPRKEYRGCSVGTSHGKNYGRFNSAGRLDGLNSRITPPFLSPASSVWSAGGDDLTATPKNLMRSIKSPLDRLFRGTDKDDAGERSTRKLIPDDQV